MDWDRVRIFYTVAEAGSFTRAGEALGLSQSAVSRQISALERDLKTPLFHRHARGLLLTEQGELLFRTARDMTMRLDATCARLFESRERPSGTLRVTASPGLGMHWLTPRLGEFMDLYPDIQIELNLTDDELDLSMREADVAIRLRQPVQGDLIQRRLFTIHLHAYASEEYLKRFGQPESLSDLDRHRILNFGGQAPNYMLTIHWLTTAGRDPKDPRSCHLKINNLTALKKAVEKGLGLAVLPDFLVEPGLGLVQVLTDVDMPTLDSYLVFPEEMKNVARVQVFRDFLISKAQRWVY